MFTAKQYRARAAEYTELLKAARLPAETREFRKREQSYLTLAEKEEWMADNLEKIDNPGADENWYGDAILAQRHTLGCHGADVATQSTAIPAKIQQLFDDVLRHIKAGAVGVVIFPLALLALSFLAAQQGGVKACRAFREWTIKDPKKHFRD